MNACCGEQKRNERLKLALHWTVSQRVFLMQRCARAGDDATPRTTVTSNIYLDILQLYAVPQFPEGVIFQQDGASRQYGNTVRELPDTTFPLRWTGRDAVMAWPPPSPDITPLDFYLWGYVKQHVYSELINDINHLKHRITDVIHSVTPDVLTRVWEELDYRLDVCRVTNGAHI
ncbi:hypothetical protein AVEN_10652-1 [Araneus ventricosus]|uniref:Uncharacterized protein n=1 Tax=Araneus ventricosus TaxID=182803 RepID=A0A4Y2UDC9_ARAVE|nr:hypothetical protein AVEN_198993-1 [Araneus ventricosus]GBO11054.1 hypothetical protein AVEN_10652-1 [Araneus ventricosus]